MANKIQIKRSNTNGNVPTLAYGELGVNVNTDTQPKFYYGNASGNATDIMEVISKATSSVLGKASFASADFAVSSGAVTIKASGVSNAQLAGSIADSKLNQITTAGKVALSSIEIDGATDIGAGLASGDLFIVDDGAGGTNRKSTIDRLATLFAGNGLSASNAVLSVGVDDSTIEINSDALRVKADGIDSAQIVDNAITNDHIADDAVQAAQIADNAVTTTRILDGTITADKLKQVDGGEAVTTATIRAGAVTTTEIGSDAVTSAKIGDDQITNDHIAANAVQTAQIANNAVTGDKLADSITIAQDLTISGNLVVSGSSTTLSVATLEVEDTFIELNKGIEAGGTEDTVDVGIYTAYDATSGGTDLWQWTGLGRDASEGKWVLFQGLDTEPSATPGAVSMGGNTARTAKLQANLEGLSNLTNTIVNYTIDCGTF